MVVHLDCERQMASYAGVGNISMFFGDREKVKWRSGDAGILGYRQIQVRQLRFTWEDGDILVLHTDGLRKEGVKRLIHHHHTPSDLANAIHAHQYSGMDDALVLVCSLHAQRAVQIEEETIRA